MAEGGSGVGSQTDYMDWQAEEDLSSHDGRQIMTVEMRQNTAQILLNLGIQQEIRKKIQFELSMAPASLGLQICIPDFVKTSYIDEFIGLINDFRRKHSRKICFHFELTDVVHLPSVHTALCTALHEIDASLDIDTEKHLFLIFARNEDVLEKSVEIIQKTLTEGRLEIGDIKAELDKDAEWCRFQLSLDSQSNNQAFIVETRQDVILIAGLYDTVEEVYNHLKRLTNNLRISGIPYSRRVNASSERMSGWECAPTTGRIKVDFPVESQTRFSYLKLFHKPFERVEIKAHEDTSKQGFTIVGLPEDVEASEKELNDQIKQIKDVTCKFEDNGYFSQTEGNKLLEETIVKDCRIVYQTVQQGQKLNRSDSENHNWLTPVRHERQGQRCWSWTVNGKCNIVLAESKVDEMSAEVVLSIMQTKSPGQEFPFKPRQNYQKCLIEVPYYIPGPVLETCNKQFTTMFKRLAEDNLQSVAVSIDNTGSWPVVGIVPRIIRSYVDFLEEENHYERKLSLLICSAVTDNVTYAEKIIQQILEDEYITKRRIVKELPIKVRIVEGKLHETKADALVNTTAPDLDLSNGAVSKSLLAAAGQGIQKEIYDKYTEDIELEPGEITVTRGYGLSCSYVIHGVLCPLKKSQPDTVYKKYIGNLLRTCLEEAADLNCRSIAFPAIGTGKLQYPTDIVASEMFWTVHDYGKEHPSTTLKEVSFVLFPGDQNVFQVFKEKEKELEEYLEKEASQNNSWVNFHFTGLPDDIEKAKQHIQDRLDLIQSKDGSRKQSEEIHGISDIQYQLLRHFYEDVIEKWNKQGFIFHWENDVLKIKGHRNNILVVKTQISSLNEQLSELPNASLDVKDIDVNDVEMFLARQSPDDFCLHIPEKKVLLVYGHNLSSVEMKKRRLASIKSALVQKQSQDQLSNSKEDSRKRISIKDVSHDIFKVMRHRYTDMNNYVITYSPESETAVVDKRFVKEFKRIFSETNSLHKERIAVPSDKINLIFRDGSNVCSDANDIHLYDLEQQSITVFGTDLQSVSDEIHTLKLNAGLIGTTKRARRVLTESFEAPNSAGDTMTFDDTSLQPGTHGSREHKAESDTAGGRRKNNYGQTNAPEYFITYEGIPVHVYEKEILHLPVDCIVNAANENLEHGGGIAKVISKAAGYSLDKECLDRVRSKGKLKPGEVYTSNAGKLDYQYVIHAVGPRYSDYKPHSPDKERQCKQDLRKAVWNSLKEAENRSLKTIAIPAISSAIFAVPEDICTDMYAEAVATYSKRARSPRRLKEIHFVDNNSLMVAKIQKRFREIFHSAGHTSRHANVSKPGQNASSKTSVTSSRNSHQNPQLPGADTAARQFPWFEEISIDAGFKHELHCHVSSNLHVIVDQGSVFEKSKKVNAIVCSDKKDGQGKGFIAKTLLDKGGHKYKSAVENAFKQNVRLGEVVVVNGEGTGFRKVFVAVMANKDPNDTKSVREKKFRSMFTSIFQKAIAEKCPAIVMPLLFTGQGNVRPEFCTERFLESCLEFSKTPTRRLTVYLTNNETWKTEIVERMTKDFITLQNALKESSRECSTVPSRPPDPSKGKTESKNGSKMDGKVKMTGRSHPKPARPPMSRGHQAPNKGEGNVGSRKFDHDSSRSQASQYGAMALSLRCKDGENTGSKSQFYDEDDTNQKQQTLMTGKDQATAGSPDDNCVICMDSITNPKKIKCGHVFCADCIDSYFLNYKKVCPTCGVVCGIIRGDQPPGRMEMKLDKNFHCAGYERVGAIIITYSFDSGKQGSDHPSPGKPYKGITRTAFLPDNREGREVYKMLRIAFERKLVFTIGSSRTTGQEGVITWNDIHHKTNPTPHSQFGYPDPGYLDRVRDELAVKGVTSDDITA